VIAVGKRVKHFQAGDLVACVGAGFAHHAEIICVPEQLVVRIANEKLLKAASLTGVGAIALQCIRRASLSIGEIVCVMGVDTLGQLIVQLAKIAGARVIAIDFSDEKLALAKKCGAEYTYQLNTEIQAVISNVTQEHGVDCTIVSPEYITNKEANLAVSITRKQGRLVLVGSKSIFFEQEFVQHKEIDMIFSMTYGPGRYDAAYEYQGQDYPYAYVRWTENRNMMAFVHLLSSNQVNVELLVGKEITFEKFAEEFKNQVDHLLGIIISYEPVKRIEKKCFPKEAKFIPARKGPSVNLNVTFFGANRTTRLSLLPIVKTIARIKIHRIIDRDVSRALNASKQYIGAIALAGDPELFYDDPTTDVVCITSNCELHAEHIIKALGNGKALYLHRTFLFNEDELKRLKDYLECNNNARLCIGYYRSAAPFMKKIKKHIKHRRSPLMIQYRLNLNALDDRDSIDQRPRFGNIVDKASHIFDLFHYLTDAKPLSVSVEALRPACEHIFPSDNFIVQMSMNDGSVCSLQVTALGHKENGVERMELHYDGKTIVMEDFIRLTGFGLPKGFDEVVRIPDKGKEIYTRQFFNDIRLQKKSSLFDIERLYLISNLTMHIDHLVCQGGGEIEL